MDGEAFCAGGMRKRMPKFGNCKNCGKGEGYSDKIGVVRNEARNIAATRG